MDLAVRKLPKISVVTPSLNCGRFLEETILSVLTQDYPHIEHLVIDGGSTDATLDIVHQYDGQLAYWESRPDRGQSHAINRGFMKATGDIVAWLNGDDLLLPGALSRIALEFARNPDAAMIFGSGVKIDEQGRHLKDVPYRCFEADRLSTSYFFLQPASFWSRRRLLDLGWLDESLHYAMDWDLALRARRRKLRIEAIPYKIASLRMHAATKTATGGSKRMREIARIGRRANGITDPNFVVHLVLLGVTGLGGSERMRARVRSAFRTLYSRPFMVA
jgi:glycosyltransferase involved in cell wall biosynthesis